MPATSLCRSRCLFGFFFVEREKWAATLHTPQKQQTPPYQSNMTNNRNAWGSHNVDAIALVTTLLLLVVVGFASASSSHAVSRWKAPNSRWRNPCGRRQWPLASPMPHPHVFWLVEFIRHIMGNAVCAWFGRKWVGTCRDRRLYDQARAKWGGL